MTLLPTRIRKARFGIAPRRVYQTHRSFVRKHSCSIRGCQRRPIEFAHLRSAANSGTALKPIDCYGISLCQWHHDRATNVTSHAEIAEAVGMTLDDLFAIAAEFARRTPDKALREYLKEKEGQ